MWKNIRNSKMYVAGLVVTALFVGFVQVGRAGYINPGSSEDPIVTQSYVEKRNQDLLKKIEELENRVNITQENQFFQVIELQKGHKLIGKASTEIILRSGKAKTIASSLGGLSDLIAGIDLKNGEAVPLNHLILVPRDDGRGIEIQADGTFVLIKGGFEIR